MTLREKQSKFAQDVALLIIYIYSCGYSVTFGDAARMDRRGHVRNSDHYKRLAIDLNLFDKNGKYLRKTEDHVNFGMFWEMLGHKWGGYFKDSKGQATPDGNHYAW